MPDDPPTGDNTPEEGTEDETSGAGSPARSGTWQQRLSSSFLKPPKPKAPKAADPESEKPLTDAEKAQRIKMIDPTERKLGYGGAILAVIIGLIATAPFINDPRLTVKVTEPILTGHKCATPDVYQYIKYQGRYACVGNIAYSRSHWLFLLGAVLVFAVALFITTRIARRAPLAFVAIMTGLALLSFTQSILAFPYVLFGGWLIVRAYRAQKYGTTSAKEVREIITARRTGTDTKKTPGKGTPTARPAKKGKKAETPPSATGRTPPSPNKRYTPKAPPKKKVPPPPT